MCLVMRYTLPQESRLGRWREFFEIKECQEIDGLELAIQPWSSANLSTHREIGSQQSWNLGALFRRRRRQEKFRLCHRSQFRIRLERRQLFIYRPSLGRILRRQR